MTFGSHLSHWRLVPDKLFNIRMMKQDWQVKDEADFHFSWQLFPAADILPAQQPAGSPPVSSLPEVRRIYVSELIGAEGDMMRELIISGLNSTRLFVLTDNADRADAVLKGAADDKVFTDSLDVQEGISSRENGGKGSSGYAKPLTACMAGSEFPTASLTTRRIANMKRTQPFACAIRTATFCGLRLKRASEQNFEERARTLQQKLRTNWYSIWNVRARGILPCPRTVNLSN